MPASDRAAYFAYAESLRQAGDFSKAITSFFAEKADIKVVHPFDHIQGAERYLANLIVPLQQAFNGLHRREDIVMAGQFEGQHWISAMGYYAGCFSQNWLGIRPTNTLCYLRFGEFHHMENDQAVESYVFLDIPELMIACGQWPIPSGPVRNRGYTGLIQGPAHHDGIIIEPTDPAEGARSYRIVTEMLARLATEDQAWKPYWHENMMWYGPGAFGSFIGVDQFSAFQVPFEAQFEGWSGGSKNNGLTRHFTRFGDGNYACSGGWPSLTGVNVKPFLGQGPTNERVFMRVCDWWRREGDLLVENWVFVDVPHALLQMGFDPLPKMEI